MNINNCNIENELNKLRDREIPLPDGFDERVLENLKLRKPSVKIRSLSAVYFAIAVLLIINIITFTEFFNYKSPTEKYNINRSNYLYDVAKTYSYYQVI